MNTASSRSPVWPEGAWFDAGSGHRVWWCEGGDPQGRPVLILHGGPGGASRIETTRWFDGLPVRWIVFDQRGCGRSTPLGAVEANDLAALLADADALRQHLRIDRWGLLGGSWGARVALGYGAAWSGRVAGVFLRSPFLGGPSEATRYAAGWIDWLGEAGRAWLGPERVLAFQRLFQDGTTECGARRPFLGDDDRLACAWSAYDDAQSAPGGAAASRVRFDAARLPVPGAELRASWRVHAHYAANGWGAGPAGRAAWRLDAIAPVALAQAGPTAIVWGEADATCDPASARALAAHWPQARAREVAGAGHRMGDARLGPVLAEEVRRWAVAL